jgi:hypothetical protein
LRKEVRKKEIDDRVLKLNEEGTGICSSLQIEEVMGRWERKKWERKKPKAKL